MRGVLYIIIACSILSSSCQPSIDQSSDNSTLVSEIKVQFPDGSVAGKDMWLLVHTLDKINLPISIIVENSLGIRRYESLTRQKLIIPGHDLTLSGKYSITAIWNGSIIGEKNIFLNADAIAEPLDVYVGPNSILVGGKESTMITAIPTDKHDNGISSKNTLQFQTNKNNYLNQDISTNHMLAHYEMSSGEKAKQVIAGVSHDNISTIEQSIIEEPEWAINFTVEIVDLYPYADNRQYTRLRSSKLYDDYGNQIADGTIVTFLQSVDNRLQSQYNAVVIDGVCNVYMRNPALPRKVDIEANIGSYSRSNTLTINYKSNIASIGYQLDIPQNQLIVGPVRSHQGQFIPAGNIIEVLLGDKLYRKQSIEGYAEFDLDHQLLGINDKLEIMINGSKEEIDIQ